MNKKEKSAGELLALKLKGDSSITEEDIKNATKNFFKGHGVNIKMK